MPEWIKTQEKYRGKIIYANNGQSISGIPGFNGIWNGHKHIKSLINVSITVLTTMASGQCG